MSEKPVLHAIRIFAHYAGQDFARWQTLIGQRATHKTFGAGVVVGVTAGSGSKPIIAIAFPDDDKPSRSFTEEFLANQSFFTELSIPLDTAAIEAIQQELLESARRVEEQEAARRQHNAVPKPAQIVHAPRRLLSSTPLRNNALLEVLSVPAGRTLGYIQTHHVHAHPESYSYRQTPYIAFRAGDGGEMHHVYDLGQAHIFLMNPDDPAMARERIIANQPIAEEAKERVRRYHTERQRDGQFDNKHNEEYRFYLFPTTGHIELPHRPQLQRNLQSHTYFSLGELTSGRKIVRRLTQ